HTVTATVKDKNGNGVPSQAVAWTVQSGPGSIVSQQNTTDLNGAASATITSAQAGTTVVRAAAGCSVYSDGTKTWKPFPVTIDIKPGSSPNSINLGSRGVVPVAILTTSAFDAAAVDPSTVVFAGASPVRWVMEDVVPHDGKLDMLLHFKTEDLNLTETSTSATLSGKTLDGLDIEGTDSVRIVPPKK
ncbi:MAG: Ig-like domain-containing protein, partial [Chloroflexota bacterium]